MPAARNHMRGISGPQFIAAATADGTFLTTLDIAKPSGVQNGHLLVAVMGGQDGSFSPVTWTGDTGWTERVDQGADPSVRVATKVASSEGSTYSFTPSGIDNYAGGAILAFSGAAYDTIGSVVQLTNDGDLNVTGLTSAGGINLLFVYSDRNGATISTPTGYTLLASINVSARTSLKVFAKAVSAGATGTATATIGGGTAQYSGGVQIGIKAA